MDLGSIIGLIIAWVLVIWSIGMGGSFIAYLDYPSVLIVFGGGIGATLAAYPLQQLFKIGSAFTKVFKPTETNPLKSVEILVNLSEMARREGILALERSINDIEDDFLQTGIRLAVDGIEPELIKEILQTEIAFMEDRHKKSVAILDYMMMIFPAMGMIGTLIGLVAMLQNMSDPSSIGPSMAVAILTTLYGALIANLLALPAAKKLVARSSDEIQAREVVIEGIMAIQSGDNPRIVEQRLLAFLPPAMRPQNRD